MLIRQLAAEWTSGSTNVRIFDRTSIDNYCFLEMRTNKRHPALRDAAVRSVREFEFLVDVSQGSVTTQTKNVSVEQRQHVRTLLDELLREVDLPREHVTLDPAALETSIDIAVNTLASKIRWAYIKSAYH